MGWFEPHSTPARGGCYSSARKGTARCDDAKTAPFSKRGRFG